MRKGTSHSAYLYSFAGAALIALTGAATGIVSSRVLGPTGRGQLTALLLLPAIVGKLGNIGFIQGVAYLDNPIRKPTHPVAGTALIAAFCIGCVVWLCLVPFLSVLLPALPKEMLIWAALCLGYVPVNFVFTVLLGAELAQGDFRTFNIMQAACGLGQLVSVLLFLITRLQSPTTFAVSIVLAPLFILLVGAPSMLRMLMTTDRSTATLRAVVSKSAEYARPEIAGLLLLRCDQFLVASLGSNEALGLYTVVMSLAFGQALTAGPLSQVAFHTTSSATSPLNAVDRLARQFRLFQIFFFLLAAATIAIAPLVIRVAFGDRFVPSTTAARILILAMAIWSCSQTLEGGMRGMGFAALCSRSNLLGIAIVLLLGASLVKPFGIEGVALSALVAQSVSLGVKLLLLRRATGCRIAKFSAFGLRGLNEFGAALASLLSPFWNQLSRYHARSVDPSAL